MINWLLNVENNSFNFVDYFSNYTCHKIFVTHTDRHFPEIIISCLGHSKMCKFVKNWKLKIFMKPILFPIYIQESKNVRKITRKLIFLITPIEKVVL